MEKQFKDFIGLFLMSSFIALGAHAELPPEEGLRCKISLPGEVKDVIELKGDQDSVELPLVSNRKALGAVSALREKEQECKRKYDFKCLDDFYKERRNYQSDLRLKIVRNIKNTAFPDSPDNVNRFMVSLETVIHGPGLPSAGRIVPHAKTEVFANLDPTFDLQPDRSKEDYLKYARSHYVSCEVIPSQPKTVLDEYLESDGRLKMSRRTHLGQRNTKATHAFSEKKHKDLIPGKINTSYENSPSAPAANLAE